MSIRKVEDFLEDGWTRFPAKSSYICCKEPLGGWSGKVQESQVYVQLGPLNQPDKNN
jgi:hypothetical protein